MTNVPMYLAGAEHPDKTRSVVIVGDLIRNGERLVTDVEVQRHPEEPAYGGLRARKQYRGVKMPVAPPAT